MGESLRDQVRAVMVAHWRPQGHTVPNAATYPWQWLWDSCFHALIWAELDRADRAVTELASALSAQAPDGFVPHMRYVDDPTFLEGFWGRPATSSITQPPMYGHAVAELERQGVVVPDDLRARAVAGVRFLLDRRARDADGLVTLVHPWESGCDDSPRWDSWCPGGWTRDRWFAVKGDLLATIERSEHGSPVSNPAFAVGSVAFTALVAWNARELGLDLEAAELVDALDARWDPGLRTWVDGSHPSGSVRTAEALLPALVCDQGRDEAAAEVLDPRGLGGEFGPAQVHRAEAAYDADAYWRGPAWPQLTYLLARAGLPLGDRLARGAEASGLAEYWHPDTGRGMGAIPQSWAGLAIVGDARS